MAFAWAILAAVNARNLLYPLGILIVPLLAAAEDPDQEMWDEPSHQLVFSYEGVRVVDVNVAPGVVSQYHNHRLATLYVVVQDAKIRSQRQGADWFDLSDRDRRPAGAMADRSAYVSEPYVHRVHNVDDRALHLVAIISERPARAGGDDAAETDSGPVDNAWFRESRIALGPGASSEPRVLRDPAVLVQYDDGPVRAFENGVATSLGTVRGAFSWHAAGAELTVVNGAGVAREFVLVEVRQPD